MWALHVMYMQHRQLSLDLRIALRHQRLTSRSVRYTGESLLCLPVFSDHILHHVVHIRVPVQRVILRARSVNPWGDEKSRKIDFFSLCNYMHTCTGLFKAVIMNYTRIFTDYNYDFKTPKVHVHGMVYRETESESGLTHQSHH